MARLSELKVQVVGIGVNDPFSNKAFADQNMLNFPLISDYNCEAIKLYGIELRDFAGLKGYTVAKRSIFVLKKNGVVRYRLDFRRPRNRAKMHRNRKNAEPDGLKQSVS